MPEWVPLAVVGVGGAHLWAYYGGRPALAGTLKAMPILLLAVAALAVGTPSSSYPRLVAAGLVCSAIGDVCLVSRSWFLPGLASFLVAHLFYLCAFASTGPALAPHPGALLAIGALALGLLAVLWPHLGRRRLPVTVYVGVIAAMAWAAVSRAGTPGVPASGATLAAVGAVAFMTSDAILAVNRFARPFPAAHAWVMCTYYLAQTAIAASTAA